MFDATQFGLDILGVFFGAFAAFELDNYRERLSEGKERLRVLKLIRSEVTGNNGLLTQLLNTMRELPGQVPYTRVRTGIWNGIAGKLDIITNDELLTDLTQLYYGYDLLERIIDVLSEHATGSIAATDHEVQDMLANRIDLHRKNIIRNITAAYPSSKNGLLDAGKKVIEEIDQEIKKLDP